MVYKPVSLKCVFHTLMTHLCHVCCSTEVFYVTYSIIMMLHWCCSLYPSNALKLHKYIFAVKQNLINLLSVILFWNDSVARWQNTWPVADNCWILRFWEKLLIAFWFSSSWRLSATAALKHPWLTDHKLHCRLQVPTFKYPCASTVALLCCHITLLWHFS